MSIAVVTHDVIGIKMIPSTTLKDSWTELDTMSTVNLKEIYVPTQPVEPTQYSATGWKLVGVVHANDFVHWYWSEK